MKKRYQHSKYKDRKIMEICERESCSGMQTDTDNPTEKELEMPKTCEHCKWENQVVNTQFMS